MASRAACRECERRSWLLSVLSVRLQFRSRDEARLLELLELDDDDLIDAIAGRRRPEIRQAWKRFDGREPYTAQHPRQGRASVDQTPVEAVCQPCETVCKHFPSYPKALRGWAGAPHMLHVLGGTERLERLTAGPTVAIAGGARPSDYGLEMARSLARGLSASGVTVLCAIARGVQSAVIEGVLEAERPALVVMSGGVDCVTPVEMRGSFKRTLRSGCAIAELPCGQRAQRWSRLASVRTAAGLAQLTIVVEAGESPSELRAAETARSLRRAVAAMPGRVSSPASAGTNSLLHAGVPLVRDAADALDLLSRLDEAVSATDWMSRMPKSEPDVTASTIELEPRLRTIFERVGSGRDTPGKLTGPGEDAGATLLALAELEVMGLLSRGDGGRYVPRESIMALRRRTASRPGPAETRISCSPAGARLPASDEARSRTAAYPLMASTEQL